MRRVLPEKSTKSCSTLFRLYVLIASLCGFSSSSASLQLQGFLEAARFELSIGGLRLFLFLTATPCDNTFFFLRENTALSKKRGLQKQAHH